MSFHLLTPKPLKALTAPKSEFLQESERTDAFLNRVYNTPIEIHHEEGDKLMAQHGHTSEGRLFLAHLASHGFLVRNCDSGFHHSLEVMRRGMRDHLIIAAMENSAAAYALSRIHAEGLGTPRDLAQSNLFLRKAAQEGYSKDKARSKIRTREILPHPEALYWLGLLYANGKNGFDQDQKKAVELLEQSAHQNYREALYALAYAYRYGKLRLPFNHTKAGDLFERAMAQEHIKSLVERGKLLEIAPLPNAYSAFLCYQIAVTLGEKKYSETGEIADGFLDALRNLARIYDTGIADVYYDDDKVVAADMMKAVGLRLRARELQKTLPWIPPSALLALKGTKAKLTGAPALAPIQAITFPKKIVATVGEQWKQLTHMPQPS